MLNRPAAATARPTRAQQSVVLARTPSSNIGRVDITSGGGDIKWTVDERYGELQLDLAVGDRFLKARGNVYFNHCGSQFGGL
jgi:hypothetical protein